MWEGATDAMVIIIEVLIIPTQIVRSIILYCWSEENTVANYQSLPLASFKLVVVCKDGYTVI